MSKIVYLCHYDTDNTRKCSPAARTMMDYVIEAVVDCGAPLTVVSPAQLLSRERSERVFEKKDGFDLIYTASYPRCRFKYNPVNVIKRWKTRKSLERELLDILSDGDVLLVYHSLALCSVVDKIRKKRNIKLVLETCEIYTDVISGASPAKRSREVEFIKSADAYVFSSALMAENFNLGNKPYAVCLGTYRNEPVRASGFGDGKIHTVYAGTFDSRKGGVMAAIGSAQYLDEKYHLHILGFGTDAEVAAVKSCVAEVSKHSRASLTYDGCLAGEDYIRFIQSCDIGLSTQNPDAAFNATSFPSKILSYMANGLQVVSIDIPAISGSSVGGFVRFYKEQSPENIAKAVSEVDLSTADDPRGIIRGLDSDFKEALARVIAFALDGGAS